MTERLRPTLAALLGAACTSCAVGGEPARPNLLLVVIDTLRADRSSAYGYELDTTPALRGLAGQGVRFEAAYAPSATTGPSHATLFTGLQPYAHGVLKNGLVLGDEHATLAETLTAAGYQTAAVVSSYVLHRKFGFARGFASYQDDFDPQDATLRPESWEGERVEAFDRRAEHTTERALDWLRDRDSSRPFFLFVHYFDPHDPYVAPPEWQRRFAAPEGADRAGHARALYDAEVAYTDAWIGRLLAGLQELGLEAGTLVVVTADHGEGLFDHGYFYHGVQLYEEAVRVPLLVRWPGGLDGGRVVTEPVALVDLLPTLLELTGSAVPADALPGASLADALRGDAPLDPERPVYLQREAFTADRVGEFPVAGEKLGLRVGVWKYLEAPEEGTRELFHLERDPAERRNLADAEPERVAGLARRLAPHREALRRVAEPPALEASDRRRLEALGYTE